MAPATFLPGSSTQKAARSFRSVGGHNNSLTLQNTYLNSNGIISREIAVWVADDIFPVRYPIENEENDPVPFFYYDAVTNNTILGALIQWNIDMDNDSDSDADEQDTEMSGASTFAFSADPNTFTHSNTMAGIAKARSQLLSTTTNSLARRNLLTGIANNTTSSSASNAHPSQPTASIPPSRIYPPPATTSISTPCRSPYSLESPFTSPPRGTRPFRPTTSSRTPHIRASIVPHLAQIQAKTRLLTAALNSTTGAGAGTNSSAAIAVHSPIYRDAAPSTPRPSSAAAAGGTQNQQPARLRLRSNNGMAALTQQFPAGEFGGMENEEGLRGVGKRKRSGRMGISKRGHGGSDGDGGNKGRGNGKSSRVLRQIFEDVELEMGMSLGLGLTR